MTRGKDVSSSSVMIGPSGKDRIGRDANQFKCQESWPKNLMPVKKQQHKNESSDIEKISDSTEYVITFLRPVNSSLFTPFIDSSLLNVDNYSWPHVNLSLGSNLKSKVCLTISRFGVHVFNR